MKKVILLGLLALSACGGGSGSGSSSPDLQGLFVGTLNNGTSGTVDGFSGLIDANGEGVFVDTTNAAIFRITDFDVSGNTFTGSVRDFAGAGQVFQNGQTIDTSAIVGSFAVKGSLSGSAYPVGGGNASQYNANYKGSIYEIPGSFTTIAGTYKFSFTVGAVTDTVTFVLATNGNFTGTDTQGCTLSGSATIPDSSFNAYELNESTACAGNTTNGNGLAFFTPATSDTPATLTIEYDNGSTQAVLAIANRQ